MPSAPEERSPYDQRFIKMYTGLANIGTLTLVGAGCAFEFMGLTETDSASQGWRDIAAGIVTFGGAYAVHKMPTIHDQVQIRMDEFIDRRFHQ